MDCLLFVSRGKVVEKQGAYDDNVPEIVYQQGNIINLHLLNHHGNNKSKTTIFCHEESSARIVRIDHTELAKILNEQRDEIIPNYMKKIVYKELILQNKSFDQYISLTQIGVKQLVQMCEFKMYKPGDEVMMKSGGIVWKGKLSNPKVPQKFNDLEYQMISPAWEIDQNNYKVDSDEYVIVQHYPSMNGLDMK